MPLLTSHKDWWALAVPEITKFSTTGVDGEFWSIVRADSVGFVLFAGLRSTSRVHSQSRRDIWELAAMAPRTIAVVCKPGHPALDVLPCNDDIKFLVANDMDTFSSFPELDTVEGILWIPPGDVPTLRALYEKLPVKWVHSFSAGTCGSNICLAQPVESL